MNKSGLNGKTILGKRKLLFLLFLLTNVVAFNQVVTKSGNITSNETWAYDTVKITGDITVDNSITLTINPGCVISFQGHYSFNVQGCVIAEGESNNRITFRAVDTILTSSSGGWQGIRFDNTNALNDTSVFKYCNFYHGNAFGADWFDKQGAVFAFRDFGKAILMNNMVLHSQAVGANGILYVRNASPLILGNLIANNAGTGIELSNNANPIIINNTIVNNLGYGINRNSYTPLIKNCIISGNSLGSLKEISNQGNYISYSNLLGTGFSTNSNIDIDPKFTDENTCNYRLTNVSPCIDAGSLTEQNYDLDFDIDGNARIYKGLKDTLVDMGAYEFNEEPIPLFTFSSDTLKFNDLLVGESQILSIEIENNEAYPITLSSIYDSHADFEILGFTGKTLNTGEKVNYNVKFAPKDAQQYSEYVIIECNYKKQAKDTVWLSAKGLPSPKMILSQSAIEETLNCTTDVTSVLTIQNAGSGVLNYSIPYEFIDDFNSNLNNWVSSGSWGLEAGSYNGSMALTENPEANYNTNVDDTLTQKNSFHVFDAEHCILKYMLKTDMENCCDSFITEIKINNKAWRFLDHKNGIKDWTLVSFDLSSLLGSGDSIKIRFRFNSDNTNSFGGIWLDDLQLTGTGTENLWLSSASGSINPGESKQIDITFDANSKVGNNYKTNFRVLGNDPVNQADTVGLVYNLNRFNTFELISDSLKFDTLAVLSKDTLFCQISNYGCDTLKISKAFTDNAVFWVDSLNEILVPANDTAKVPVIFYAADSLNYRGKVFFVNNSSTNDTVSAILNAKGGIYPILQLSTHIIDTSLMCDDTVHTIITLSNTGSDTLNYKIPTDLFFEFSETINEWEFNGTWGLETDTITQSVVLSDSPLNNYLPLTNGSINLKEPFYVFDAANSVLSFDVSHDIETCCDSLTVAIKVNGNNWQVLDSFKGNSAWVHKSYNLTPYLSSGDSLNIRFVMASDGAVHKKGVSIDNVKLTGSGCSIITLNRYEGQLLPTESQQLQVSFTPKYAFDEQVKTDFRIISDAPFKLADTVSCNYYVNTYSTLELLNNKLEFKPQKVFNTDTLTCNFLNTGCDTLKITDIQISSNAFKLLGSVSQNINPSDTGSISLVFHPTDSLLYGATLKFISNSFLCDTTIATLIGKGMPYPVLSIDTNQVDTSLYCHEQLTTNLVLRNFGNDTLHYKLPEDFYEEFSNGASNWDLNNGWSIAYDTINKTFGISESVIGDYLPNTEAVAQIIQPLLINDAELANLSYDIQYDIESCCDYLYTEVSVNHGAWQMVAEHKGISALKNVKHDLSELVNNGDSLLFRFRFVSDYTNAYDGSLISNVQVSGLGTGELMPNKLQGTILPNSTDTIMIYFDAAYHYREKYQKTLQISTNNPYKGIDSVLFSYNVKAMGSLNLVTDTLAFRNTDVLLYDTLLCKFYNIGCDTLHINEVFVNNSAFKIDSDFSKEVLPSDTGIIRLLFAPVDSITYQGNLSIVHSGFFADTSKVALFGKGNPYAIIELIEATIDTTQVCGTQAKYSYQIKNKGTATLNYYIPVDFVEDFENGIDNWDVNGNWGLIESPITEGLVLTESPQGNYSNNEEAVLTLKNSVMVLDPEVCSLSFDLYHEIENCCDFFITEIQVNNGTWMQLDKVNNRVDWSLREFDLSTYVNKGDNLRLRFRFISDIANNYDGVLLDNVIIKGGSCHELELAKNRGELSPGASKRIDVDCRIPIGSLQSLKGNFLISSNDPFKPVDILTYKIANNYKGIQTFHGGGRSSAVSFVINSSVYVALGAKNDVDLNDVWRFDEQKDFWVQMNDFPAEPRSGAVACVINDTAYVGLGYNQLLEKNFNDWYRYDARKDRWTRVADFAGLERTEAVSFIQNGKAFVGTGINHQEYEDETKQFNDFWAYNPKTNRWDSVAKTDALPRSGAVAFSVYNKGYVAGGFNKQSGLLNDIWEFSPDSNNWVCKKVNDTLGLIMNNSACQAFGNSAYITYGNTNRVYVYHPQSNKIEDLNDTLKLVCERRKPLTFFYNNKIYFGLGEGVTNQINKNKTYPHVISEVKVELKHSPTNLYLSKTNVNEQNVGIEIVGRFTTTDLTINDEFKYDLLSDTDHFYTQGNRLYSKNISYEQIKSEKIKIRTTDNEQNYFEKEFFITINDVAEAPSNLLLNGDSVNCNASIGTLIGRFTVNDDDTLEHHTYELSHINNQIIANTFTIIGDSLLTKSELDENITHYDITVKAVDKDDLRTFANISIKEFCENNIVNAVYDNLLVYPNPATDRIFINKERLPSKVHQIYIVNIKGDVVAQFNDSYYSTNYIDVSGINSGVYMLVLKTKEQSALCRMVIK